ncbi:SPOR domain-containing protein [Pedobacter frigiditerrae]|uniref:SPOR domain-containing protein n=1 Tax=Pedobacter frigiditerrae TaxID=2530452 RepID=A0A4R0MRK3_9SPHI|nr:SPOR domain-containing protein [Pedobacter frigiditerrae]TCC89530.1 SPOR domain-containing protein [Pedobacter frigiditerrae]
MDILLYLTELLQTRKTVGIVGLGTLYKKKLPGKYDVEQHAFIPPTYTIAFTRAIKEEEELANYISHKRHITTDSANYYIGEFAEQIQTQLAENQEADLNIFGKLKYVNDELVLVGQQETNFGFEFYGLPTLTEIIPEEENTANETAIPETIETEYLEEIEEENKLEEENPGQETTDEIEENVLLHDEQETFEEIAEVENRPTEVLENTFIKPPVIETVEAEEKEDPEVVIENEIVGEEYIEEEEPKKGMPFLIKALIILLVIIAAGAVAYFINPTFFNKYLKNFEGKQDKTIPVAPIDSLSTKTDSLLKDSLTKTNAMVNLAPDTPAIDSSKVTVYEILVSAVATEKKANKIIANLAKNGVPAKKIKLSKTMINISAGSFLKESEAKILRDSLRKKLKNEGIYIQPVLPKTHKN